VESAPRNRFDGGVKRSSGKPESTAARVGRDRSRAARDATRFARALPGARAAAPDVRAPLERHWVLALIGVFALALLWRLAYLGRLDASPLARSLIDDERSYWDWATYLIDHGFRGTNPFFLGPLYPYLLALVRSLAGSTIPAVLTVQAVFGSLAAVLLADAARRFVRPGVALGVGVVAALYQMSVFFDGLVLMESPLFLFEAALLWQLARMARSRGGAWAFAFAGLTVGLMAECRGTGAVLLALPLVLAFAGGGDARARRKSAHAFAALIAFAIVIAPSLAWNRAKSGEWIPISYNFGYNLYVGNHAGADGGFVWTSGTQGLGGSEAAHPDGGVELDGREFLRKTRGLTLSPAQSSRYWANEAMRFIRSEPGKALQLAARKLRMTWNWREYAQIDNADVFRKLAGPLGLPLFGTFAVVGALGLVGFLLAGPYGAIGLALRLYVTLLTLATLPFFVTDRYRVHLVPALLLLAGVAVNEALSRWRSGATAPLRVLAAAGVLSVIVVMLPAPHLGASRYQWSLAYDIGSRWLEHDRPDLAVEQFEKALRVERAALGGGVLDSTLVLERASLHYNYALALQRTGHDAEAISWLRTAAAEAPGNAHVVSALADAYRRTGQGALADSLLGRLGSLVGGEGEALANAGWQAAREGRLADAENSFQRAVEKDQHLGGAWGALIRLQVQRGRYDVAQQTLRRAQAAGIAPSLLHAHEALVFAALGNRLDAARALAQVPESAMQADPSIAEVVAVTRRLLGEPGAK
jgi:4-amino-4-deoxy-L-arabinose transferase-like glycosyltransferase